jgi:hypothetical protein
MDWIIRLAAFSVIGAVLGLVIGYAFGGGFNNFLFWAGWEPRNTAVWAIGGLIVGAAVAYLCRRNGIFAFGRWPSEDAAKAAALKSADQWSDADKEAFKRLQERR